MTTLNRLVLGAVLLLLPSFCFAQDDRVLIDKSRIPPAAESVQQFIPSGWKIEEQLSADLNGDAQTDYVLKLVENKPEKDEEGLPTERHRALVIALQTAKGTFARAAVADKLLQCTRCGGAFYGVVETPAGVTIEKGVIVIEQEHGSRNLTNTTYRFRHDRATNQFVLVGFDYADADRLTAEVVTESTNYLTGVRKTFRGKGKRDVTRRTTIPKKKLSIEDVDYYKFEEGAAKRLGI